MGRSQHHVPLHAPPPELASGELPSPIERVSVDAASDETFLFVYVANAKDLGVFVPTERPFAVGTELRVTFAGSFESDAYGAGPFDGASFDGVAFDGEVVWINPVKNDDNANPGMGIRLLGLGLDDRDHLVSLVRAVAYLDEPVDSN